MMLENYKVIKTIDCSHEIYLVKSVHNNSLYVKKTLDYYDKNVYNFLSRHKIDGVPFVKEYFEIDKKLIVIEEYIPGTNLETILKTKGTLSEFEVRNITISICGILKRINDEVSLVHRDIKPSNIIIKDNKEVFLVDYDAAKIIEEPKSRDTVLLGTQGYAAPEQYGFASSNIQTDIYAIGVMMKELLTGCIDLNEEYTSGLKRIIQKCTMMEPKSRYQNYQTLIRQLKCNYYLTNRQYLPVGFRSGKPLAIFFSILWYSLIMIMSFSFTEEGITGVDLIIDKISFAISFIAITFFLGNYLNCQNIFKINKIKNKLLKFMALIIMSFFILIFIILIAVIIEEVI